MTMQRITRLVFWLDGVVVSGTPECQLQPGMAQVLDELKDRFELWLVSDYSARHTTAVISQNGLSSWFDNGAVYVLPDDSASHQVLLQSLVAIRVITPGSSLWIDDHPARTMVAVRQGIDASIFVDARRLRRDLWLWGIVSPE